MKVAHRFKTQCVACERTMSSPTKEHFWPQWLIARTKTHKTGVRFSTEKLINPKKLVVPMCGDCNSVFGDKLEKPVSELFERLENGHGLSDLEAEIMIRWLWKFEGLAWCFAHPWGTYTDKYTLRQRVLRPIDEIRSQLTLAISLAELVDPSFGDAPMGLDSFNKHNAVFVAGVFSRTAVMVLLTKFESLVPSQFSLYRLAAPDAPDRNHRLFFPQVGFKTCVDAAATTADVALLLSYLHDTRGFSDAA